MRRLIVVIASLALRVYLHFFNNYTVTYGSLGAVIILLTWFYITGLMLLLGAEINSEIDFIALGLQPGATDFTAEPWQQRVQPARPAG